MMPRSQVLGVPGRQEACPKRSFIVVVAIPSCYASGSFWWAGYDASVWELCKHSMFEARFIRGQKNEAQGHPRRALKGQSYQLEAASL